jgi:predicted O-methyltransferase YrrM
MSRANRSFGSRILRQIKSFVDVAFWPGMIARRRFLDSVKDWPNLIEQICKPGRKHKIFANQHPNEIGPLCELVKSHRPRVIVEIGTSCGGTLYLWSRIVEPGGIVVSIDKPGEPGSVRPVMRAVYRTFGHNRQVTSITIDGDSHSSDTHEQLRAILAGRRIGFLFIDGDHSYEGVKSDFEFYRSLVASDGLIAMHDVSKVEGHTSIEVPRFWNELAGSKFERKEFVAVKGTTPGIGVVAKAA